MLPKYKDKTRSKRERKRPGKFDFLITKTDLFVFRVCGNVRGNQILIKKKTWNKSQKIFAAWKKISNCNFHRLKFTIATSADVNSEDMDQRTTLHIAANLGDTEILSCLLAAKPNLDKQDMDSNTPLILAATRGHADVVDLLASEGCDLEQRNVEGNFKLQNQVKRPSPPFRSTSHQQQFWGL